MPGIRNHNLPLVPSGQLDKLVAELRAAGLNVVGGDLPENTTGTTDTMAQLVFNQDDVFVFVIDGKVSINWKREK